jgi:hypothetical protein
MTTSLTAARPETFDGTIRVGQKVHCILYGGKDGYVLKVNGQQSLSGYRRLGLVVVAGGSATVDVVFTGHRAGISRGVPE